MTNELNAYPTFIGKTRFAMEFCSSVIGGDLTLQTFKEKMQLKVRSRKNSLCTDSGSHKTVWL